MGMKNFEFFFKSNDALRVTRNTLVMNAPLQKEAEEQEDSNATVIILL